MDEQQFREIDGRHKDLIKLEGLIKETNGLFVDISNITDAQGEILDNIEYNVTISGDKIGSGTRDVSNVRERRKQLRKIKILMMMVCLGVGAAIGVTIMFTVFV
ncbi:syntaxin-1B-like [Folsomia candida]|uniref:syntaxin-1B-like n=1 Tax=Folsomia candida TaxID=158441 RepID=UPI000B9086F7|nr:syntaxin-1B-like [Folsomia candida]